MTRFAVLLAAFTLLLAAAPGRAEAPACHDVGSLGEACVEVGERHVCADALVTGGATDLGVGAQTCAESRWYGPCASASGGLGTLDGLYGADAWACVLFASVDLPPVSGCVAVASGSWGLVDPVCVPHL